MARKVAKAKAAQPKRLMASSSGTPAARTLSAPKLKADRASLVIEATKDGKLRVLCSSWDEPLVVLPGRELVVRNIASQVNVFDVAQGEGTA